MYQYKLSSLEENNKFFNEYIESLSSRYDDYLEHHILNSKVYSIYVNNEHSGYFGIFDCSMLTQFYMPKWAFRHAQAVFEEVIQSYGIKNAFVPTCDETFLSLCMDKHTKVNLQAYFFEESNVPVRPAEYPREMLKQATMDELQEILEVTGDFLDTPKKSLEAGELYILRDQDEFLGLGIIVKNDIMKNCKGTGMFVNEKHRGKGVGRSIILHLKEMCHEEGVIPLPGCWYYNHNSKRTLESCGYISKTRLLRIDFGGNEA